MGEPGNLPRAWQAERFGLTCRCRRVLRGVIIQISTIPVMGIRLRDKRSRNFSFAFMYLLGAALIYLPAELGAWGSKVSAYRYLPYRRYRDGISYWLKSKRVGFMVYL
jgi:hypothetical protein